MIPIPIHRSKIIMIVISQCNSPSVVCCVSYIPGHPHLLQSLEWNAANNLNHNRPQSGREITRGIGNFRYTFERNERSETPCSYLGVREQEAKAYGRRVDQALTSPGLLLQTEVRKDPYAARVRRFDVLRSTLDVQRSIFNVHASRSEIGRPDQVALD